MTSNDPCVVGSNKFVDTVEILSQTVDYAGLDWNDIIPENIDMEDEKVWQSIIDNNVGIFQYESDFAHQVYKSLFSPETIAKIKKISPNTSYMDLFSIGNAIIRPAGASYRESVMEGEFYDNGHKALNEFLAPTLGRLVYQEQIIQFLVEFCGYSGGEADVIRRAIGKKDPATVNRLLPEIKEKFVDIMVEKYGASREVAKHISEPFMRVILDASNYGFSINHSDAYSALGYACAYLRYYYPLEFITASLNVNIGKEDKTNRLIEYAKTRGIEIRPIKFRYSRAGYMFDKETNSIYQGVEPIKFLNAQVAEDLYNLRDKSFNSFVDLLVTIKDGDTLDLLKNKTVEELKQIDKELGKEVYHGKSIPINAKQMKILISLNYFSEFGNNKKLLTVFEAFDKRYKTTVKLKTRKERYEELLKLELDTMNEPLSLVEQCSAELEFLGHIVTKKPEMPANILMVVDVDAKKSYTRARLYQFSSGETREVKMGSKAYSYVPFKESDVIEIKKAEVKPKNKKINGRWQPSPTEKELWLKEIKFIRKREGKD